ncbi:MAG: outer membrane beta-barrel protein [Opitutae bacterium]|nr:outer membrane beta-barrel protein [Opitutae bacterium]
MPKQKHILTSIFRQSVILLVFLQIVGQMYALFSLIDGRVDVTTKIKEQYDSNIGSSPTDPISDRILTIRPGAKYLRDAGRMVLNVDVGMEVGRFDEDQRLNYENPQGTVGLSYPNQGESKWQISLNSNYTEASSPNPIIGERISSETFTTLGNLRYSILPIYGIGINFVRSTIQSNISPSGSRLSDLDQDTMGALVFYKYSDMLEFTLNYRFRDNQIIGNPVDVFSLGDAAKMSGQDETFSVGASGQLTSLLTGGIDFGGQRRRLNGSDEDLYGLFTSTNLTWQIRPDITSLALSVSADTTPTPTNDSIKSLTSSLNLNHTFSPFFSGTAGISYGDTDFTNTPSSGPDSVARQDTTCGASLGFTYNFNEYFTSEFLGAHTWTNTNSGSGYKRTLIELGVNLKL